MDIKLPLSLTPPTLTVPGLPRLNLQAGQALGAKVINAMVTSTENAIALKLGNQSVTVLSSQPLILQPGQNLAIQVTKVTPYLEFKLLTPLPEVNNQAILLTELPEAASPKQLLQARVVGLTSNQIQLQIMTEASANPQQKAATINIDRASTSLPAAVCVGQQITLEINRSAKNTKYRLITNTDSGIEDKLTTLVKQLLPKQASATVLLDQLSKDLPKIISNEALPPSLKRVALDIMQNLPQKEQLFDDQRLTELIKNSGVFLEAKLPLLIKNGLLEGGLKEIATNLLQKLPQQTAVKTTPEDGLAQTLLKSDFKANLGKLLLTLNLEISHQNEIASNNSDLEILKNLHQKVESAVAKIVLEQLASLPTEDNAKQIWHADIVFLDREKAQMAQLEIQLDKESDTSTAYNNWSVAITVTPPELGAIQCIVTCRNQLISTYFKTQQRETAGLIKDNLGQLKAQFEEQGLKVGHMSANEGDLQKNHKAQQVQGKKLFDDHA